MDDANPSHDRLLSLLRWLAAFEGVDDRKTGKVFSQNAEDGIIQHIFGRIGTESKTYVELGVQDGRECNTRHLRVKHNWTGLMIDGGFHKSEINLQRHFITTANVVSLLEKYGFRSSKKLDLLSIDTDCFDFWLTRAVLSAGYRPRVLINEINPHVQLAPPRSLSVPHPNDPRTKHYWISRSSDDVTGSYTSTCWDVSGDVTSYYGASVSAFYRLYRAYNYSMVYCDMHGINCFGVRDDLLQAPMRVSEFLTDRMLYRLPHYTQKHCGHYGPSAKPLMLVEVCADPRCEEVHGNQKHSPSWR